MEEEEVEQERAYIYTIDYAKGNLLFPMYKPLTEVLDEVVQNLYRTKPHSTPDHMVVYGTSVQSQEEELPFTVVLNRNHGASYAEQAQGFGVMMKKWGIYATRSVFIVNGLMPNIRLYPVSVVLAMSREGDYLQAVVDFQKQVAIPSEGISDEDRAIVAAVFLGQTLYRPEMESSRWN